MVGLWTALGAVFAMASAAPAGGGDAACALARVDPARTSSSSCLSCHDGSAGPGLGQSHPVEVDYASAQAREPARYAPAAALPREVVLVDGKVTCTSCHDAASPHPKRAADPARLCQACHQL